MAHIYSNIFTLAEVIIIVLFCPDCHDRTPKTGALKQTETEFSQFWRLEVQDQSAGHTGFILRLLLACRWLPSHRVLIWQRERALVSVLLFPFKKKIFLLKYS